jgi:hypothetical protein
MILGTPRIWWIAVGVAFVGGLALVVTELGGMWGNVAGVLLIIAAIALFAGAPMRYGEAATRRRREKPPATPASAPTPQPPPPPRPRADIEARDASEV